ncbi:MAG: transposase [Opitutaceae bacterium]
MIEFARLRQPPKNSITGRMDGVATGEPWFPGRLHHEIPPWVITGAFFHIRLRIARSAVVRLTEVSVAVPLLCAAADYHQRQLWYGHLLLLMPDHLHALLAFPRHEAMSEVVRRFKRAAARCQGIAWQDGYFDHRIRTPAELEKTADYIRRNPVAKGLCARLEDWRWVWSAGQVVLPW